MTDNKDFVMVPREPTPEQVRAGQLGVTTDCVKAIYAAMLQAAPAAEVRRWPFVETPGQFTDRLRNAMVEFDLDLLAAVRNVLIENPPTLASVVAAPPAQAPQVTDAQIEAIWMSPGPWSNDEIDHIAFARAVLAAQAGSVVKDSLTGAAGVAPTADRISAALAAPGCERLRDFFDTGPAQRASVETFAGALGVKGGGNAA